MYYYIIFILFWLPPIFLGFQHELVKPRQDWFKFWHELVDSASPILLKGTNLGTFNDALAFEWINKYAFGILCSNAKFEFQSDANFEKVRKSFCEQLENGKNIKEAAKNVQKSVTNLLKSIDIKGLIGEKDRKLPKYDFLTEQNQAYIEQLMAIVNKTLGLFLIIQKELPMLNDSAIRLLSPLSKRRRRKRNDKQKGIGFGLLACIFFISLGILANRLPSSKPLIYFGSVFFDLFCFIVSLAFCYLYLSGLIEKIRPLFNRADQSLPISQ